MANNGKRISSRPAGPDRSRLHLAGLIGGLGLLALVVPAPPQLVDTVLGDRRPVTTSADVLDQALLLVAGLLVWGTLAWLAVIVGCAALARGSGTAGAGARRMLGRLAPAAVTRLVLATVGVAVVGGSLSACSIPTLTGAEAPASSGASVIDIDWPTIDVAEESVLAGTVVQEPEQPPPASGPPTTRPSATPTVTPAPADPAPTSPPPPVVTATGPPAADPQSAADTGTAGPPTAPAVGQAPTSMVVRSGDSLWRIAARTLPDGAADAAIDAEWRRWYQANAALIGPDPDLILPGQQLHAPAPNGDGR